MQLQMTTDYALRILVELAEQQRVVSSTELSQRLDMPAKYVLQVGRKLKDYQFAHTVSGSKGGYILARAPEDITVYDVMEAFEGTTKINRCLEHSEYCGRSATTSCAVHSLFCEVQHSLEIKLKSETLATLLARNKRRTG
ncbi:Rrf2 family transcriptional regulator [Blautia liquoris]|uniref:Rrf2 family transcriptional regulator n=1 Tax=Blautia liquoris TaxID=2779518 RepID=A0A7M2RFM5_9FIRM|nr:Rrf2 family transcriptional regulator [Blautia liquoris]QOV18130.1 Rrf2 family transcriptional regulator [Blautia liquoris]